MLTQRGRARLLHREKDEEIVSTQIRLLQEFRPFVRSLLPDSCVTCEKCKARQLLEQEKKFQDMLRRAKVGEKLKGLSVLPEIKRCKSAGGKKKINRESRLNPRLVLQQNKPAQLGNSATKTLQNLEGGGQ